MNTSHSTVGAAYQLHTIRLLLRGCPEDELSLHLCFDIDNVCTGPDALHPRVIICVATSVGPCTVGGTAAVFACELESATLRTY